MKNYKFKSRVRISIKTILKYVSNGIAVKPILDIKAEKIMALAVDYEKVYTPELTPFTTFIEVIEGKAEIVMEEISTYLQNQEYMIIPGHTPCTLEVNQKFKIVMVQLVNT